MVAINTIRPLLRPSIINNLSLSSTFNPGLRNPQICTISLTISKRNLSSRAFVKHTTTHGLPSRKPSLLAATPPQVNPPSSFFTPSLCRHASSTSAPTSDLTPATRAGPSNPPPSSIVLDWNTFFQLRKSRRRYSLISSLLTSLATTLTAISAISTSPELQEQIPKLIPTDPFVSMGIATIGSLLLGWLIGPIFGNGVWRLLHRARLPEFTIKERAFFERIKKHRVNPSGASTNNPVPDFYGEKVGSVQGYRRWLKDQRAFNRKRGGVI